VADDRAPESDLRRRAALALALLALVAILLTVIMTQVLGGRDKNSGTGDGPRALDSAVAHGSSPAPQPTAPRHSPAGAAATSSSARPTRTAASGCPGRQTCVLDGDAGHGVDAVNEYRTSHGRPLAIGRVTNRAQQCALHNGTGCTGGWAETELPALDGAQAVRKILPFAHLLSDFESFEVGWAYDPGAKLYYFAVIRAE
jgi:hypothetical protein